MARGRKKVVDEPVTAEEVVEEAAVISIGPIALDDVTEASCTVQGRELVLVGIGRTGARVETKVTLPAGKKSCKVTFE